MASRYGDNFLRLSVSDEQSAVALLRVYLIGEDSPVSRQGVGRNVLPTIIHSQSGSSSRIFSKEASF